MIGAKLNDLTIYHGRHSSQCSTTPVHLLGVVMGGAHRALKQKTTMVQW